MSKRSSQIKLSIICSLIHLYVASTGKHTVRKEYFYLAFNHSMQYSSIIDFYATIHVPLGPKEMELKIIPAKTGIGTMKMYTSCRINLSVDNWPPKRKDMQLLIKYWIRSCMAFLFGGQLSTDKIILQCSVHFYNFIWCLGWN